MSGINPSGLRNFRPDNRRSNEPDATEGREVEHAIAERLAIFAMNRGRARLKERP